MTVTQAQIDVAEKWLTNVEALAEACDRYRFPFYLAATILDKETDGANIYGHDRGGVFTINGNKPVTEENYKEFKRRIKAGETSNGVGPMQLTWKGYFLGGDSIESRGLRPWHPADNILYGVSILAGTWKASKGSIYAVGRAYNGARLYGLATVVLAKVWKNRVGTADLNAAQPPVEPPVVAPPVVKPVDSLDGYVSKAKVSFRGGKTCSCVAWSLPLVEQYMIMMGLIQFDIDIAQLGWRTDVGDSKNTHAEGGNTDTWGQWSAAHIDVWRLCGWTMQRRDLTGIDTHAHGWPYGCPHLSPAARAQARDWDRKDAGLQGSARVQGRYPVDNWQTAYEKRSKDLAVFKAGVSLTVLKNAFLNRTKHDDVIALQVALNRHLPEDIVIDGDPGPQTRAAVIKVGELNVETLTKLGLNINP